MPLFALANAGIAIDGAFLARAFSSPITLGILVGYVVGKPLGILGASWLVTRLSRGRLRPPVGWAAVAGGGTIAGHRLHRLAARSRRSRSAATSSRRRSSACSAPALGAALSPGCSSARRHACPGALRVRALLGTAGAARRPRTSTSIPSATTSAARSTRRSRSSSTATSSARTAGGRSRSVRELLRRLRRRPLRLAAPAAQRRPPARAARRRGGGGGRRPGRVLGDARPAARAPGRARARATWSATPRQLGLDVERFARGPARRTRARRASPRTSTAPTSAASPARRRSSSTAAATTAPTTSRRCRTRFASRARRRS